jgi:hypothetical protein
LIRFKGWFAENPKKEILNKRVYIGRAILDEGGGEGA